MVSSSSPLGAGAMEFLMMPERVLSPVLAPTGKTNVFLQLQVDRVNVTG